MSGPQLAEVLEWAGSCSPKTGPTLKEHIPNTVVRSVFQEKNTDIISLSCICNTLVLPRKGQEDRDWNKPAMSAA